MSNFKPFNMYSGLQIYASKTLLTRSYVEFYLFKKRYKYYNGNNIGLICHPNRCKSIKERDFELKKLEFEIRKKLDIGWIPETLQIKQDFTLKTVFTSLSSQIATESYSITYKRDLNIIIKDFLDFINQTQVNHQNYKVNEINSVQIESFLSQYSSSGTYYMNKRRMLSVVFSRLLKGGKIQSNPVVQTSKKRVKYCLNEPFTIEQIQPILAFLRTYNSRLYLCAILMYGALLRPHQEIRKLTRKDFTENLDFLILGGKQNKSGKIRKIPITDLVKKTLLDFGVNNLNETDNIFTKQTKELNVYYFSLSWNRAKQQLLKKGLLKQNQTLYSFRHSAAINLFQRHQDIALLQRLFGHSNMIVTIGYLRGLGLNSVEDQSLMPTIKI